MHPDHGRLLTDSAVARLDQAPRILPGLLQKFPNYSPAPLLLPLMEICQNAPRPCSKPSCLFKTKARPFRITYKPSGPRLLFPHPLPSFPLAPLLQSREPLPPDPPTAQGLCTVRPAWDQGPVSPRAFAQPFTCWSGVTSQQHWLGGLSEDTHGTPTSSPASF